MAVLAYGLYMFFDYMPPPPLLFHGEAFSGMTLIIGVAAFGLFLLHRKGNTQTDRYVSIVAFAIFSIVLLLKILLQPGFAHCSFVLGSSAGLLLYCRPSLASLP